MNTSVTTDAQVRKHLITENSNTSMVRERLIRAAVDETFPKNITNTWSMFFPQMSLRSTHSAEMGSSMFAVNLAKAATVNAQA